MREIAEYSQLLGRRLCLCCTERPWQGGSSWEACVSL